MPTFLKDNFAPIAVNKVGNTPNLSMILSKKVIIFSPASINPFKKSDDKKSFANFSKDAFALSIEYWIPFVNFSCSSLAEPSCQLRN